MYICNFCKGFRNLNRGSAGEIEKAVDICKPNMNSCAHIAWLQAIENEATGQLSLEETGRLSRIVQNMPHANVQTPRLVHLIGTREKDTALKYLFPQNNTG